MTWRNRLSAISGVGLLVFTGCGGSFDSSAGGTVTLDGIALKCGWVAYHPKQGGPPAYSSIDEAGYYEISTGSEKGLPSGEYLVTVVANEPPLQLRTKEGGPTPTGKLITPVTYGQKDKSGLSYTVAPGANRINLELSSK